jgi:hypothetical protein
MVDFLPIMQILSVKKIASNFQGTGNDQTVKVTKLIFLRNDDRTLNGFNCDYCDLQLLGQFIYNCINLSKI